jgi:peptidyl-prolyl cis-trans isomerase SurA
MRWIILCLFFWLPIIGAAAETQGDKLDKIVAIVNEGVITERELNERVATIKQHLAGSEVDLPPETILRQQILQQLIDMDLQLQLAKRADFAIADRDLDRAINNLARHNNVTVEELRAQVTANGMNYDTYRENVRNEITISQLQQQALGPNIVVTEQQIDDYLTMYQEQAKLSQEYHVRNILIPLPDSPNPNQVNHAKQKAQQVLASIQEGDDFSEVALRESGGRSALQGGDLGWRQLASLPEVFAEKIVDMQPGDIAGPLQAPNGFHLIQLIDVRGHPAEQANITLTEVRHILIQPDDNLSASQARQKILELRQAILDGADFKTLATQHSADPGSASKGGELGWVRESDLVPAFAEAMAGLEPGELSQPIQTPFGYHLIEVLERKTEDDSAAQLRRQTRDLIFQRKFNEAVDNWLQELRTQSFIQIVDKSLQMDDEKD